MQPSKLKDLKWLHQDISNANIVLAPTSLVYGCEVIVPVFPNSVLMSPITNFEGFYHPVTNSEELTDIDCRINAGLNLNTSESYKQFGKKKLLVGSRDAYLGKYLIGDLT